MAVVIAHRGASRDAPENTMEAFRLAVEAGADAIHLNVHLTADRELAVIHDHTLDRTTDRRGAVAERTLDEIRQADAGAEFAGPAGDYPFRDRGVTVPTLAEVLDWLPSSTSLIVEIKARPAVDDVVDLVRAHPATTEGRITIASFDERALEEARDRDRTIRTAYLLVPSEPIERALVWATEHGHVGVHPWEGDLGLDPLPVMARATAYGREVAPYGVNDPDRMQHLAACAVWGLVTDVPRVARDALGR